MITATKKKHSFDFVHRTILIWPAVILMLIFFIAPILLTFVYSFTNLALTGSAAKDVKIIGFDNYIKMFKNPDVWLSIKATPIFLLGSVIGQQLLGFFIAFMMKNTRVGFRRAVGPCILAGWVMPELVAAMCLYAFFADNGTLNTLLIAVFGIKKIAWLYKHAMLCVVLANIWHGTAFSMLMYQAALDNVPHDMEEAAIIDGANRWQVLRYITLPVVKDTISTSLMLNTLSTLGVYTLIYTMTGGGPNMDTMTLPLYMYRQAFVGYQLGYGTAISMILLVIGIVFSVLYTRFCRDQV